MVNRIRAKLHWWKFSYPFLLAHKPLCSRFKNDVLKLGHIHLCRSCTFLYSGLIVSLILLFVISPSSKVFAVVDTVLLITTLVGSSPWFYWKTNRIIRDMLRCSLGYILAASIYFLSAGIWVGFIVHILLFTGWFFYYRKKRAERKSVQCDGCAEQNCNSVCSGYKVQADYIRKYEIFATDQLIKRRKQ